MTLRIGTLVGACHPANCSKHPAHLFAIKAQWFYIYKPSYHTKILQAAHSIFCVFHAVLTPNSGRFPKHPPIFACVHKL
jgi:hypothetical protein